jgi:hypothetical protein
LNPIAGGKRCSGGGLTQHFSGAMSPATFSTSLDRATTINIIVRTPVVYYDDAEVSLHFNVMDSQVCVCPVYAPPSLFHPVLKYRGCD